MRGLSADGTVLHAACEAAGESAWLQLQHILTQSRMFYIFSVVSFEKAVSSKWSFELNMTCFHMTSPQGILCLPPVCLFLPLLSAVTWHPCPTDTVLLRPAGSCWNHEERRRDIQFGNREVSGAVIVESVDIKPSCSFLFIGWTLIPTCSEKGHCYERSKKSTRIQMNDPLSSIYLKKTEK